MKKSLLVRTLILAGSLLLQLGTRAAVTEAWVHRYNSNALNNSEDGAYKVVRDAAGDILVVGTTRDHIDVPGMLIIKYSGADGSELWRRRYPVFVAYRAENLSDAISAAAADGSGNLVVTGISFGGYYTAKFAAADGVLLWERGYNGPGNDDDRPKSLAVDAGGNVMVTGGSPGTDGNIDYYTVKYATADGALLWEKRYNGPANSFDLGTAVAVDASGNVVVTGYSDSAGMGFYNYDCYTAKYAAADGALLWEKRYNGPANGSDFGNAVAVDASGNVVVTGSSRAPDGYPDYYTAKYAAANGALLWEKRYDGPIHDNDIATAVVVDPNGNAVVTGFSYGVGSDFYTAKYAAANGAVLWERRYNGPENDADEPHTLAVDAGGNVVVNGYSRHSDNRSDYSAVYAATSGALLWEKRTSHVIYGVALEAGGDVVVTGSDGDFYTARYAAADGALVWEKRYNGPANDNDQARGVVVDASGNVAVTGVSRTSAGREDYYTASYAAADGALLWEKRYNGPHNSSDQARAIAMDASGNVVVTGSSYGNYYTAKYAAADGALLWEHRSQLSSLHSEARAVAVDSSGNVAVTGTSLVLNFANDFYTARYAAADGALLWERLYNGAPFYENIPAGVAVDNAGNVLVAGTINIGQGQFGEPVGGDFYTAKYAAADGALVWEKRGPPGGVVALAVDGSGNVILTGGATLKYAAADGALLWEKSGGQAVAVDGSGNVVVTGYATRKYSAADGALLWEASGGGHAVAVDGGGNVVVTAGSYTARYAAADGALLWEKRCDGLIIEGSHSLALGPNGMVAITGSSDGDLDPNSVVYDYATAVYREVLPSASIARSNAVVIVSWPATALNFQLQENTDLSLPNSWSSVTQTTVTNGAQISVTVPAGAGPKFFRLKSQ